MECAMPVYEYHCPSCKSRFQMLRPMAQAEQMAECPECDTASVRTLSVFAAVSRSAEGYSLPLAGGGGCGCGGNCACSM